jgi:hypothetical protein
MEETLQPAAEPASRTHESNVPKPKILLKEAWGYYKAHWKKFSAAYLLPMIALVLVGVLVVLPAVFGFLYAGQASAAVVILCILVAIFALYLVFWMKAALIRLTIAVTHAEEVPKTKALYKNSKNYIGPVASVALLTFLALLGGAILLVVPAIIFAVWFSLAEFVTVAEGTGARESLKKSKSYVKGRFWPVFGRLLVLVAIYIILAFILNILAKLPLGVLWHGIGQIAVAIFWAPFVTVYCYLLYRYLKNNPVKE